MKSRINRKAIAGLAAGITALAVAGTLAAGSGAYWKDSATLDGATISSGDLQVSADSAGIAWQDVSDAANPRTIDLATYLAVPGDTIEGTFPVSALLSGDNAKAQLGLTLSGEAAGGDDLLDGLDVTYELEDADGTALSPETALGSDANVEFQSDNNAAAVANALPMLPSTMPADPNLQVKVTAHFRDTVTDRDLTLAHADLSEMGVTLTKVR